MPFLYNMGVGLAKVCLNVCGSLNVVGQEGVLPRGPMIVVSNHMSNADPPVIGTIIKRRLSFLAKQGLFSNPISSVIFRSLGGYPVGRDGGDARALIWALNLLKRDGVLALFPEGSRSKTAQLEEGLTGVAYLALKSQAPILPVGIVGTEKIPGFWRVAFPMCRINVRIGQAFTLPMLEGKPNTDILRSLTDMIMYRIAELLPREYRGRYNFESRK